MRNLSTSGAQARPLPYIGGPLSDQAHTLATLRKLINRLRKKLGLPPLPPLK